MNLTQWLWFSPMKPLGKLRQKATRLVPSGRFFLQNGQPWRWKGVTAFGILNRFAQGRDITPFLEDFEGFNTLRVFLYTPANGGWNETAWGIPPDNVIHAFLDFVGERGWYVELVPLTWSRPDAQEIVTHIFTEFARHENLLIELVNEPYIYDKPDPLTISVPEGTPIVWTNGVTTEKARGMYLTPHTSRDAEWPRKSHDLMEFYNGGGPFAPTDPAHRMPIVADEPIRVDQAQGGTRRQDFLAYFAGSSLFGAGATFHFESGKFGDRPTEDERVMAAAALAGLDAFPPDAPNGGYRRLDDQSLRTYVIGNFMLRVRPQNVSAPEPGWRALDPDGILFIKE